MRLLELETSGVRGLRDAAFKLDPERGGAGHVTVVTGPPQCGLTTFLDAIALSAARLSVGGTSPDADEALRIGGKSATIRSTWWLDTDERAFGGTTEEALEAEVVFKRNELGRADADPALLGLMSRYDHSAAISKVVLIPERRISAGAFPAFLDFEVDQQYKRHSSDPEKFASFAQALSKHALGLGERARFDDVARLFSELCDSVRLVGATHTLRPDFVLPSGLSVPFPRLSFVERNALVLASAPVLLGLDRSVILLDTPEMGLAPGVAAKWLSALRNHAPRAQWIVASRDAALIESVEPASRLKLTRGPS